MVGMSDFPRPYELSKARAAPRATDDRPADDVAAELLEAARRKIEAWTSPNRRPFDKLKTSRGDAAQLLIDGLRAAGYAADTHWRSTNAVVWVQFALSEDGLESDPRRE